MDLADIRIPDDLDGLPPWRDPAWTAAAEAWISESCEAAGLVRGPGTLRGRMYSVVARIPVEGGCVWFKENPPRSGFEPALVDALSRWSPQDAPPLIAVDVERRWALTHDVGERLDGLLKRDPDIRNLHTPLRRYAQLQQSLAARVEDLFALGVPDARPEHIEELLDEVLTYAPSGSIGEDVQRHVKSMLPELRAWSGELAALEAPITIDHQDLHPGNILGTSTDSLPFDWGDSVVGSAFGSILVVLRATPAFTGIERDDPSIKALRDVYLETWRESGAWTAADLNEAVELSLRLSPVIKAHVWTRTFPCFRGSAEPWKSVAFWLRNIGCEDPVTVGLA
jgi:hypothetical protein